MKRQAEKEVGNNNDIVVVSSDTTPTRLDKNRTLKKFCLPSQKHIDRIASAVNDARFKEEALGRFITADEPDIELQLLSDKPIVLRCHCEEEYYSSWLLYWPRDQAIGEKLLRWLDEQHGEHVAMVWALQWVAERYDEDHPIVVDEKDTEDIKVLAKLGISSTAQLGYLRFTVNPLAEEKMQEKYHPIALDALDARLHVVDCHAFE